MLSTVAKKEIEKLGLGPKLRHSRLAHEYPILYVPTLDRLVGSLVDMLFIDYSDNPTGGPKDEKANWYLNYCLENGIGVALFRNFGQENRINSEGSTMDAYETMAPFYPTVQVVGFTPLEIGQTPRVEVTSIHKDLPPRMRVYVPMDKGYFGEERAIEIFHSLLEGKALSRDDPFVHLYKSKGAEDMRRNLRERKINTEVCKDVTNLCAGSNNVYRLSRDIIREINACDLVVYSGGTFERAIKLVQDVRPTIDSYGNIIGPIQFAVTTADNSAAVNLGITKKDFINRLGDGGFSTPDLRNFVYGYGLNQNYILRMFIATPEDMGQAEAVAHALQKNNKRFGAMRADSTGSIAFAPFLFENCIVPRYGMVDDILYEPEINRLRRPLNQVEKKTVRDGAVVFRNLHRYVIDGDGGVSLKEAPMGIELPSRRLKIAIVNTGCSDQHFLKQNIDLYRKVILN